MQTENTHSDDFESKKILVQKIKFAVSLNQLRKVVENSSGEYVELAVGVTTDSEYVAVVYSNNPSATQSYDAFGKACPPSKKCPTN